MTIPKHRCEKTVSLQTQGRASLEDVLEGRLRSGKNTSEKAMLLKTMFPFLAKKDMFTFFKIFFNVVFKK